MKRLSLLILLVGCAPQPRTWIPNTDSRFEVTEWYGKDHCGGILYRKDLAPRSWCPGLAHGENPLGMLCLTSEITAKRYVEKACAK